MAAESAFHMQEGVLDFDPMAFPVHREGSYGLSIIAPSRPRRRAQPLQKWRLRRAVAYIDEHLGHPIRLSDLAAAAGLTRMHFAAQFRCATGVRPRHYILNRRVARACELMGRPDLPLAQIALAVGFQTQAHFSTVFRRFVGETPHRWRRLHVTHG